jgi:hypothetical protein
MAPATATSHHKILNSRIRQSSAIQTLRTVAFMCRRNEKRPAGFPAGRSHTVALTVGNRPMAARPQKDANERRGSVLQIRLTAGEKHILEKAAKVAGLGLSAWARSTLLSSARQSR